MEQLLLREFHQSLNARFGELNGTEVVGDYGDVLAEHKALCESAGVIDLSYRSRICLTGADRVRFLHGQVTNDVKRLHVGEGCYSAITNTKGKMESDLNIFCLQDELLLDFEPGLTAKISQRLEKFLVADDVQIVDVQPHYGLLSVQGPRAEEVIRALGLFAENPAKEFGSTKISDTTLGEIYLANHPRLPGSTAILAASPSSDETRRQDAGAPRKGFDLFVPNNSLGAVADKLIAAAKSIGGRACGREAFEVARIEVGIPRFGADMDETNLPQECGIEARAISYTKGCYIGQEVLNRIHSIGHVNRELRGLRLLNESSALPAKGDKVFHSGKEVGVITSATYSPVHKAVIALGILRMDAAQPETQLTVQTASGEITATVVPLPFISR